METKIKWNEGDGYITATYEGSGSGSASISSDVNEGIDREQSIKVETTDKSKSASILVQQEGLREVFAPSDGLFVLADGGTFNVLKVGGDAPDVPVETYTRLTYIEATGEQYINTGYVVQEDDIIEMQYTKTAQTSADEVLFGCYDNVGSIWFDIYSNTAYVRYGSSETTTVSNAITNNRVKIQRGEVSVDGSEASLPLNNMPEVPLFLFARNGNGTIVNMYGQYKSTGFIITKTDGSIVMNLKPCKRDSDGAIGMLDLVNGKFFGNSGNGDDFLCGGAANVADGYELIEYVTFNNDKIFDTGHYGNENTYIEILFERTDTSGADYLFGTSGGSRMTGYLTSSGYWRYGSGYPTFNTANKYLNYAYVTPGETTVSGTTRTFSVGGAFNTQWTIPVGGHKPSSGVATKTYQGYVYYFRMWHGDTIVADFIPCKRLSDGVEGFWDCVTQSFVEPI